jgi:DNA-binding transcriptional ArsR family regulator
VPTHGAVLEALADPTRRSVFECLADGPVAVVDIARQVPVSRPAVSQHLRVLKHAGLVIDEPVGTRRLYRIDPSGLQALRAYLDRFWDDALARFAGAAERVHAEAERANPDPPSPGSASPDPASPDPASREQP